MLPHFDSDLLFAVGLVVGLIVLKFLLYRLVNPLRRWLMEKADSMAD